VEIKCQLDATEVFIADLVVCSTCFGHHYAHHQELKSIIQWLLPVVFRAVVFKLLVWCGAEGYVCIDILTLDAGLLARSQYPEGPATGHLDTGFSWFPCVYKRMHRWFPSFQVATTCVSCSPPDLNFLVTFFFIFVFM